MHINPNHQFHQETCNTARFVQLLKECGELVRYVAGDIAIRNGQLCDFILIVESGCFRAYRHLNDKELITGFSFMGDVDTAPRAFIANSHSTETIEAVIDSTAVKVHRSAINSFLRDRPEFSGAIEDLLSQYIEVIVQRYMTFKAYTAEELYLKLLYRQPDEAKKIPLKYIASYLGISQERLSRIRNKLQQLT